MNVQAAALSIRSLSRHSKTVSRKALAPVSNRTLASTG
jgi:hypothetical protein